MSAHALHHTIGHVLHAAKNAPPPPGPKKNPWLAASAGLIAGPIGLGLFFGSFREGLGLYLVLLMLFVGTGGLATPIILFISAAYGFARASSTKAQPDALPQHLQGPDEVIEARQNVKVLGH